MSKKYTAAIIGAGSIGHAHMEGYELVDEVEVVAVVDPVEIARKQYTDRYNIKSDFPTVEKMLEEIKPDIVSVCTWHLLHPAPTILAAKAGVRAVICEKPMAIGMNAADSMVESCAIGNTELVISHQRRFTPGWEKAKNLVQSGAIGIPLFVTNKVADGLTNWGTHSIDGSRFVLGDPKANWVMGAVERKTDRYERDTAVEDACMGLVNFDNNLQLFIQSDLMREGASAGHFQIRGSEGYMEVTELSVKLHNTDKLGWQHVTIEEIEGAQAIGGNTNAAQVRELIDVLEGKLDAHRNSGVTARATVEIMMALYESARRNAVIHLPLEERGYPLEKMIAEGGLPVEVEGRYDIRSFLKWEGVDIEQYKDLLSQGLGHHRIMMQLHENMSKND